MHSLKTDFRGVKFSQMVLDIATPIHQREFRGVIFLQIEANPRKLRKFHPSKITRYTVIIIAPQIFPVVGVAM